MADPKNIIKGTSDSETLEGTPDSDRIISYGGKDTLYGLEGDDQLNGYPSNKGYIHWNSEESLQIFGGQGNDFIVGGSDRDQLFGGDGDDVIHGRDENDDLFGGSGNDKLFEKLCIVLELNDLPKNEKFKSNSSRCENMNDLKLIMEEKLKSLNTKDWIKKMENEKIPCGPIFNIKDAVENPQIKSRNMIVDTFHKVVGDFKTAGNPIKMSSYKDETKRGDIPDLDEHRKKIIEEFCN